MGALPPVRRLRTGWRPRALARVLAAALALTTGGAVVTACAPARPTPTPVPVSAPIPVPEKPVPVDPLAEPWLVGVPTSPVTHEIVVTTAVRAAATSDALANTSADSLRTTLSVRWDSTSRTTVCRDSIPLTLTSTRRYVVEDARVQDGRVVVVLRRRSTTTLSGTGSQFGEPVTITGEGQGELLFGLRLDDGQMTDGNGVSTLTLSLTGRRKSQVVTQNARLEIRRAF